MKKKISLNRVLELLSKAEAIIWDKNYLAYPSVAELTGEDENEFLYLSVTDDKGLDYAVNFAEGANREVTIKENALILIDTEGDECSIQILRVMDL